MRSTWRKAEAWRALSCLPLLCSCLASHLESTRTSSQWAGWMHRLRLAGIASTARDNLEKA